MLEIERELVIFLHAFLVGIVVFACYVCLGVVRKCLPHRNWVINIEDAGYWTGVSIYLFVQFYHTNNGKIRWFGVLGIVLGALFLWKILAILEKMVKKIHDFAGRKMGKKP